jgi:thioredoxin reductase (NADPH)
MTGLAPDLIVIGAGPTGIAIGAAAVQTGIRPLLIDQGALTANLLNFPTYMNFFTTRDLLEIADIPFAIPEEKPDRRQAAAYYRGVAQRYELPLALHEEVIRIHKEEATFEVVTMRNGLQFTHHARAVALATGYFHNPRKLGVPGEERPWIHSRYRDPYPHFSEEVVIVGGGNSAAETALDLHRNGAHVTIVHRGPELKRTIKYWVKPDVDNRIQEGVIDTRFGSQVKEFGVSGVVVTTPKGEEVLPASAAYVLIGYEPDVKLQIEAGIEVNESTLVPRFNRQTCESNVEGLYVAGTLQAGRRTDRIFIENSRDHGRRIIEHLRHQLLGRTEGH